MIRILHIDDKQEIAVALDEALQEMEEVAVIEWYNNFERGVSELRNSPSSYNGIILDAKCFLNDQDGSLDEQFVIRAINDVEKIFKENNIWMPYCVLSGFKEKIDGYLKSNSVKAFDKDGQEEEALDYIISNQKKVYRHLFIEEFPGLLQFLNGENGEEKDQHTASNLLQLYGVIKKRQTSSSIIKAQIAQVRPLLEKILIKLNGFGEYDGSPLIPDEYVSTSGSRTQINNVIGALIYLEGQTAKGRNDSYQRSSVLPAYLSSQAKSIYNVTSDVGSHSSEDSASIFTLIAMFYSLIDLLFWYKNFIEK